MVKGDALQRKGDALQRKGDALQRKGDALQQDRFRADVVQRQDLRLTAVTLLFARGVALACVLAAVAFVAGKLCGSATMAGFGPFSSGGGWFLPVAIAALVWLFFQLAAICDLWGQRREARANSALVALLVRTGGVAGLAVWIALTNELGPERMRSLVFLLVAYGTSLAVDTSMWVWQIKLRERERLGA